MTDQLDEALEAARARWPGFRLSRTVWRDTIATRFGAGVGNEALASIQLHDLALATACLQGDARAQAILDELTRGDVVATAANIDPAPDFVEDVQQVLRIRLLVGEPGEPRLRRYSGHGPLKSWVNISAVRVALNLHRTRSRAAKHLEDDWVSALAVLDTGDPELDGFKHRYRHVVEQSLRIACKGLSAKSRTVLRMHFLQGHGIDTIGRVFGVHRATAARWVHSARADLTREARKALEERLETSAEDALTVERWLRSQLELSFSQLQSQPPDRTISS